MNEPAMQRVKRPDHMTRDTRLAERLRAALPAMPDGYRSKAESLIAWHNGTGSFSVVQRRMVVRLLTEVAA